MRTYCREFQPCVRFAFVIAPSALRTMASRQERLDALNQFRSRVPHLSQRALAGILGIARAETLPRDHKRSPVRQARDQLVHTPTPYGPVHQTCKVPLASGGDMDIELQNPLAMLYELTRSSETFSRLVERTFERSPPSAARPWGIILYNDEVTPGAEMRAHNPRKLETFYWSIYEFGMHVLSDEESWLECILVQSALRARLQGGLGALTAAVLKAFFGAGGHDVRLAGVQLQLASGRLIHVWMHLKNVLADEAALHAMFACKGASGLKVCMLCANVFNARLVEDTEELARHGGVTHTCGDTRRLQLHTEDSLKAIQTRLQSAKETMGKGAFEELEKYLGWRISVLLRDAALAPVIKPTQQVLYDTMHVFFSKGIFQFHVGVMLVALKPLGVKPNMFDEYLKPWQWPKMVATSTGQDVFCEKRIRSCMASSVLTCQASECVSMYPVVANFVQQGLLRNVCLGIQAHGRCFLQLVLIVELVLSSSRYTIDVNALKEGIRAYMVAFRELYGEDSMPPKFHQMVHFVFFIANLGWFPNCWVLERKHKIPKRFAGMNFDVRGKNIAYSASVLREVTCRHISQLRRPDSVHFVEEACLIAPRKASKRIANILVEEFNADCSFLCSNAARINKWEKVSQGDMVSYQWEFAVAVGKIELLVAVTLDDARGEFAYISVYDKVSTRARDECLRPSGSCRMVVLHEINGAMIWMQEADGHVVVLRPWIQRQR